MTALLRLAAPFTLWLVAFSLLYGLHGLACAARSPLPPEAARAILAAAALGAVAAQVALAVWLGRRSRGPDLLARATGILAVAAVIAVAWTAIPALVLPICEAPLP